jgi:hypothetical protein
MALGSTNTLTEVSTRNLLGVKGNLPAHKADYLTVIYEPIASQSTWPPRLVTGIDLHILSTKMSKDKKNSNICMNKEPARLGEKKKMLTYSLTQLGPS